MHENIGHIRPCKVMKTNYSSKDCSYESAIVNL